MKLSRINAMAFGALHDCALDGIGDGLTIVLGPNESGKSTYAALVRQVLYGFPDKRTRDRGYVPRSGSRAGALTFEGQDGTWSITRIDGAKGGSVSVEALRGDARPQLLSEIVGSVTPETFKVVFGFGLDELDDIEHGTDKDVVARLFAGAHGLRVNPVDVRNAMADSAAAAFKPRGNSAVGDLHGRMRETRTRIREIEEQAKRFAGDQVRIREMEDRLAPLRAQRDALDVAFRELERDLASARNLVAQLREAQARSREIELELEDRTKIAEHIVVDERLLAVEPDLRALLDQESGSLQHANHARQLESLAAENRRSAKTLASLPGVDAAGAHERIEAWRDRRARLQADVDSTSRSATEADSRLAAAQVAAQQSGVRSSNKTMPVTGGLVVLVGVLALAAGALTTQWIAAGAGVLAMLLGAAVIVLSRRAAPSAPVPAEVQRFEMEARAAEVLAEDARRRFTEESAAWTTWLEQAGLDTRGEEPAAVTALIDEAQRRSVLEDQAAGREEEASRDRAEHDEWARRLISLARGPLGVAESEPDPRALAIRAREALSTARDARERKTAATLEAEAATRALQQERGLIDGLTGDLAAIAAAHAVDAGDPVVLLEQEAESRGMELRTLNERLEALSREHSELVGSVGLELREDTLARARQELEGLAASAQEAADRFVVETLAARLIDTARERYERERQPAVVRKAANVFERMTNGRYADVVVPMDGGGIKVVTGSGAVLPTSQLSRGAAEQLYLALRVGLIESFGAQGPHLPVLMDDIVVNYDAQRLAGAGQAVGELAATRQVIFFTCHERTASTLADAVSDSKVIELDRCTL